MTRKNLGGLALFLALLLAAPEGRLAAQSAGAAAAAPSGQASAAPSGQASAGAAAAGTAIPLSESAALAAALEFSASVIDKRAAVDAARLDLGLSALWRQSRLDAKAGYAAGRDPRSGEVLAPESSWSLQASLPLVTGLGLSASVTATSLTAGASLSPFAQKDLRAGEALEKALIIAAEAERQAAIEVRAAYRAAWLAILDQGVKEKSLAAAEAKAEAASLNAAAGAATVSAVIDADAARVDAMVAALEAKDRADTALAALSQLVGRTVSRGDLAEPDPGADRPLLSKEAYLASLASLATQALDMRATARAAKPELPALTLSGSLSQALDEAGLAPTWSLSASLQLDPDTFLRGQDKATALRLEAARRGAATSRQKAEDEYAKLLAAVASRRAAVEAATRILTTARLSYEKNSYLAAAGTVSGASLLDAEKSRLAAEYSLARARGELGAAIDALDGNLLANGL